MVHDIENLDEQLQIKELELHAAHEKWRKFSAQAPGISDAQNKGHGYQKMKEASDYIVKCRSEFETLLRLKAKSKK